MTRRTKANAETTGVVVIIYSGDRMIVQRKTPSYPVTKWRNCLSFFGGSLFKDENPRDGLLRELNEEIPKAVSKIEQKIAYWRKFRLRGASNMYNLHVFRCELSPLRFDDLLAALLDPDVVLEGTQCEISNLGDANEWRWMASLMTVVRRHYKELLKEKSVRG